MRTKYKPWAKPYLEEHVEVMCPFDKVNDYKALILHINIIINHFSNVL